MKKNCQKCGQENLAEAAFCRNCSTPLTGNQFGGGQGNMPPNQQNFGNQQNFSPQSGGAGTRAIVGVVLVISSLFCCFFTSVPAAIVGWLEVGAIKRGESSQDGLMMAQIALWGGIVITVLSVIGGVLWMILAVATAGTDPYGY